MVEKVYLAIAGGLEAHVILGAFSSRDSAEHEIKRFKNGEVSEDDFEGDRRLVARLPDTYQYKVEEYPLQD